MRIEKGVCFVLKIKYEKEFWKKKIVGTEKYDEMIFYFFFVFGEINDLLLKKENWIFQLPKRNFFSMNATKVEKKKIKNLWWGEEILFCKIPKWKLKKKLRKKWIEKIKRKKNL